MILRVTHSENEKPLLVDDELAAGLEGPNRRAAAKAAVNPAEEAAESRLGKRDDGDAIPRVDEHCIAVRLDIRRPDE